MWSNHVHEPREKENEDIPPTCTRRHEKMVIIEYISHV